MHAPIASPSHRVSDDERPRRIGLVVDHPVRDLDGMCHVAQLLAERGAEAVLLPFYAQHFDLPNVDLDLIVLNYARPANLALIEAAAARGIALAVLDTEGGLLPESGPTSPAGIARFLKESGLDRALSLYLFWGDHLRDVVVAETALPPDRAMTTGCPRFDLKRRKGKARAKRVLINTNFPIVNSLHADGSGIDAEALRSVGYSERDIADLALSVGRVMERMIATISTLAKARPGREFVVRPHPFEREDPYEKAFANFPNVRIERKGTAMEAIAASDCLLHVNCTTAVEACLCTVPPISLDFINESRLRKMAELPSKISHCAQSQAEVLALIDCPGRVQLGDGRNWIEPLFGPLDGNAGRRVVDALLETPLKVPDWTRNDTSSNRPVLAAWLGRVIGSGAIEALRRLRSPARAAKGFGAQEVAAKLARLARMRGTKAAKVEPSRSALGLPTMALTVRPHERG